MTPAVILLNFGEPEELSLEVVIRYLERIFAANARLDGNEDEAAAARRSRDLAARRAPGLLEEYRAIGGSPLGRQCAEQARALEQELLRRGRAARTYVGMQFTEPGIPEVAHRAEEEGADLLVGVPVYPLCGRSTTVAALDALADAVRRERWKVSLRAISGWHRHPAYLSLRTDAIRRHAAAAGVALQDPGTRLVFSAHGTPLKYLREGNRYEHYVGEWCASVARELGVERYALGYQNHANRGIEWTRPEIVEVVSGLEADRIVVDAVSFMHEQSETLSELDLELRQVAERAGLAFHRVPIPHDDPRFAGVLADLVEPLIGGPVAEGLELAECRCRSAPDTVCLNAGAAHGAARASSRRFGRGSKSLSE
ncbi:MAG: ferrochelatase [Gemmatimonadota bacterium]